MELSLSIIYLWDTNVGNWHNFYQELKFLLFLLLLSLLCFLSKAISNNFSRFNKENIKRMCFGDKVYPNCFFDVEINGK